MAHYTMTIYEMMNNPLTPIFPEEYDFYTEDEETRKNFEKKFIETYLIREIEYETPYVFTQMLKAKLDLIMPYYKQLYQTEWMRVKKDMMNSKDLTETTKRIIDSIGNTEQSTKTQSSDKNQQWTVNHQTVNDNQSQNSSSENENNHKESMIRDGVSQSSLSDGYLTGVSQDKSTQSTTNSINQSSKNDNTLSNEAVGYNTVQGLGSQDTKQNTIETVVFNSKGDIGVQTPAYAITEWRKVIINLDKMIIDDLKDLFLKIY